MHSAGSLCPFMHQGSLEQRVLAGCCLLHPAQKAGPPTCPPALQALEALQLDLRAAHPAELLRVLRAFPRLKDLALEGHCDEGFTVPTAALRHLPALERLDVCSFGTMALSEPLPRLTSLAASYARRLELGAGATLPSLRSLESEGVYTVVLRCSLPRLTRLCIKGNDAGPSVYVSVACWPARAPCHILSTRLAQLGLR